MRGRTPLRMALTHIYHHDQPQRLSGMDRRGGLSALSPRPGALLYGTVYMQRVVHCQHHSDHTHTDTHTHTHTPTPTTTHTHARTHGASCILHACTRLPDERIQPWAGPLPLLNAQWLMAGLHVPLAASPTDHTLARAMCHCPLRISAQPDISILLTGWWGCRPHQSQHWTTRSLWRLGVVRWPVQSLPQGCTASA